MPNRMLRDWTDSMKVKNISCQAEVFFVRLIMKADDYGCYHAQTSLLKAYLYPLKLDTVREADITRWMTECHKAGLIALYNVEGKDYLQIIDFKQRLDKARPKFPHPPTKNTAFPEVVNDFPAEIETENEPEKEKNTAPKGADSPPAADESPDLKSFYSKIEKKDKKTVLEFIRSNKPDFIEPHVDMWNHFAEGRGLSKVKEISKSRRQKFSVRIKEKRFDFLAILTKAAASDFLITGKWFGFDWLLENDKNYLKVLEGNYDPGPKPATSGAAGQTQKDPLSAAERAGFDVTIKYLFERFVEGELDRKFVKPDYYDMLTARSYAKPEELHSVSGRALTDDEKVEAVMNFLKMKSTQPV